VKIEFALYQFAMDVLLICRNDYESYPRGMHLRSLCKSFCKLRSNGNLSVVNGTFSITSTLEILIECLKWLRVSKGVIILGFRTTEIVLIVIVLRFFVNRRKTVRIVFDNFVPLYQAFEHENKWNLSKVLRQFIGPAIRSYEKYTLQYSDLILTDTISHKELLCQKYNVDARAILPLYLGAHFPMSLALDTTDFDDFTILYYANFQNLHGLDLFLEAYIQLPARLSKVRLYIVGKCKFAEMFRDCASITFIKKLPFTELMSLAASCDLCIGGPFSGSDQAQRVITGKTFQFLKLRKCCLVGRNLETLRFSFNDRYNCILCDQGCADSIREAIIWAITHRFRLVQIGLHGRKLYDEIYNPEQQSLSLTNEMEALF